MPPPLAAALRALSAVVLLAAATLANAQAPSPLAVLTVDPERLFAETAFGLRAGRDIETRATALATENRRIEAELTAEERELTEKRATLSIEEFRALADAFDEKVDQIRAEQDAKTREVQGLREEEQQRFFRQVGPILRDLLVERRGLVLLDRRQVIAAAEAVDITDEAIARIDAEIGDGTE